MSFAESQSNTPFSSNQSPVKGFHLPQIRTQANSPFDSPRLSPRGGLDMSNNQSPDVTKEVNPRSRPLNISFDLSNISKCVSDFDHI